MTVYNVASTRRRPSLWGAEVKKRLIDGQLQQDDLVTALRGQGVDIDKITLSNLLYGSGISTRQDAIVKISDLLGIPYQT